MRRIATTILISFIALSHSSVSMSTEPECKMVMGWEPWPPIQFMDENQRLTGLDVELMRAVFTDMGCQLSYREGNWTRSLFEVKSGTMDALSSAEVTEDRLKWARFSDSYRDDSMVMYMLKGRSKLFPIKSLDDIIGTKFRLGVLRGVNYGPTFAKYAKRPEFKKHLYFLDAPIAQRYKILQAGRIDAFTYPPSALSELEKQTDGNIEIHPFVIHSAKQHVMFSRKSVTPATVDKFNSSLKNIVNSGDYEKIVAKYKKK